MCTHIAWRMAKLLCIDAGGYIRTVYINISSICIVFVVVHRTHNHFCGIAVQANCGSETVCSCRTHNIFDKRPTVVPRIYGYLASIAKMFENVYSEYFRIVTQLDKTKVDGRRKSIGLLPRVTTYGLVTCYTLTLFYNPKRMTTRDAMKRVSFIHT